jgi:hypothetical protein
MTQDAALDLKILHPHEKVIVITGQHEGKVGMLLCVDQGHTYTHLVRFRSREYWFLAEHLRHLCRDCKKQAALYVFTYHSHRQPTSVYYCDDCAKARNYRIFGQPLSPLGYS